MDLALAQLATQVAIFLAPHLKEAAKDVGKAVGKKLTNTVADEIWSKLTGSDKKADIEDATELTNGEIDVTRLALAIGEALQATPALKQDVEQIVTVHGDVFGDLNVAQRDVYNIARQIVYNLLSTATPQDMITDPAYFDVRAATPHRTRPLIFDHQVCAMKLHL